jgi:drug/metabolite transporter (DMT)-like permease
MMLKRIYSSGPFWMVVATLCFAMMGVFVKLGSRDFSTGELVFYRSLVALVMIYVSVRVQGRGRSLKVPPTLLRLHLTRSIVGTSSMLLLFYAIAHLPLPTAVTLNNTSSIFLMLISVLWLGQRPGRMQIVAILLGFVGVVLLLRPSFSGSQWLACLIALTSAFGGAIALYNVRELGKAGEPEWRTVFYFSVAGIGVALIWMLFEQRPLAKITFENIAYLLGMAVCATGGQLCLTRAYQRGRSLVVASLNYLNVMFSSLFGVLIWSDSLPLLSYVAMSLIVAGGIVGAAAGMRPAAQKA